MSKGYDILSSYRSSAGKRRSGLELGNFFGWPLRYFLLVLLVLIDLASAFRCVAFSFLFALLVDDPVVLVIWGALVDAILFGGLGLHFGVGLATAWLSYLARVVGIKGTIVPVLSSGIVLFFLQWLEPVNSLIGGTSEWGLFVVLLGGKKWISRLRK